MSENFTNKAKDIIKDAQSRCESISPRANALAYHLLQITLTQTESLAFLDEKKANEFISAYNKYYDEFIKDSKWEEVELVVRNETQIEFIEDKAKEFADDIGHSKVGILALLYGCCSTILGNTKNGELNTDEHRVIMTAYQILSKHKDEGKNLRSLGMIPIGHASSDFANEQKKIAHTPTPSSEAKKRSNYRISDEDHEKLLRVCVLMNDQEFQPFFGREKELGQVKQILAQSRRGNPILVGEAGVGKTAIVEGLVEYIEENDDLYPYGQKPQVYALDVGNIVAGTMYRGMLEQRVKDLIEVAKDNKGDVIIFIDEVHELISGISSDAVANQLKPALARGDITIIGATTLDEYRKYIEKDKALNRRFEPVIVAEPDRKQTIKMLNSSAGKLEMTHHVTYALDAMEAAYDLGKRYLPRLTMPDVALSLLDAAGAASFLKRQGHQTIGAEQIAEAISGKIGRPIPQIMASDAEKTLALESLLGKKVFGQDKAVQTLSRAVQSTQAGLQPANKTRGSFLFSGPTGVGKTEAAKTLADTLNIDLIRIDMSEYMDKHAVSKLIGAPSGYVGYHEGGVLTEAIYRKPHAVLLLDEVDKAHPDIFNVLLQALDNGFIRDGQGRDVDFRNVYLIMTTNAGQVHKKATGGIGFTAASKDTESISTAINQMFAPEFRNRLDETVHFHELGEEVIKKVAVKALHEKAQTLLENKGIRLAFTTAAQLQVAKGGFDAAMGARPLTRYIAKNIDTVLAPSILRGEFKKGDCVRVDFKEATDGEEKKFTVEKFNMFANNNKPPQVATLLLAAPTSGGGFAA